MRILLVKLTSMGDLIHTLPAITDAQTIIPDIKFDWVVEEGFAEIAHWHPAVENVFPVALRNKNFKQVLSSIKQIRKNKYDLILDAQGLCKSAILTCFARGIQRAGFNKESAKESVASLFYSKKIAVEKFHAIHRLRLLFANAIGYVLPKTDADYGVDWENVTNSINSTKNENPYVVFLHGTTWVTKHWPEEYWLQLADIAHNSGYEVQVTWATEEQKARAKKLARHNSNVKLLPHLTINQAADLLKNAAGIVAVDTGFAHLSAAIGIPTVAAFGSTDSKFTGIIGSHQINIQSKFECSPCLKKVCKYPMENSLYPPCFKEITPQIVWENLARLLKTRYNAKNN